MTELSLVMGLPVGHLALEIRQVFLCYLNGICFIISKNINHPVGHLEGHWTNLFRCIDPKSATFDHGWTTHRHRRLFGGNNDIATRNKGCITGKGSAIDNANERNQA